MDVTITGLDGMDRPTGRLIVEAREGRRTHGIWVVWACRRSWNGRSWDEIELEVRALAMRVIADRLDHGEQVRPEPLSDISFLFATADDPGRFWRSVPLYKGKGLPTAHAKSVLTALIQHGWSIKRRLGADPVLGKPGAPDIVFAFDNEEEVVGCRTLASVYLTTGIHPDELVG